MGELHEESPRCCSPTCGGELLPVRERGLPDLWVRVSSDGAWEHTTIPPAAAERASLTFSCAQCHRIFRLVMTRVNGDLPKRTA
jgi:hypothetical protein